MRWFSTHARKPLRLTKPPTPHQKALHFTGRLTLWSALCCIVVLLVPTCGPSGGEVREVAELPAAAPQLPDVGLTDVSRVLENVRVDAPVPPKPLPGMKRAPCDPMHKELELNGGCYNVVGDPPCHGVLFRWGDKCVRRIASAPAIPTSVEK